MSTSTAAKSEGKPGEFINVVEFGVPLCVNKESLSPKKNYGYYCQEMDINRALVSSALSVYCESGRSVFTPVKCIDVIGSTGVAGILWKKYLADAVDVSINDPHEKCLEIITENCKESRVMVKLLRKDPCVLLQEEPFSFIYLDCHTEASLHLDSLMRNITKQGLICITTKDDGALYGRTPEMALRNYGGVITRAFYSKELAARLIISGMVRAAAVHSKGLEILCVLSVKSTITIIVRVLKGPTYANLCLTEIRRIVHCNMCEDRAFYPSSIYPVENPAKLLSCKCAENTPGKVVVDLGPVWSGSLYDFNFLLRMKSDLAKFPWKSKLSELLEVLLTEAWCPKLDDEKILQTHLMETRSESPNDKKPDSSLVESLEPPSKKQKEDMSFEKCTVSCKSEPPFYFNLHKHCPQGPKMVRAGKIVLSLQKAGFRACRTHFDPLAVRTNATFTELKNIVANVSG